ncbi:unnamed protein product [Strongylus vulgaris]|uniref:Uncharacterized protein n=1 Tax=Strongylus vulgaris TaxID=40348 RepID=A0A3P7IKG5_STRVU|nr:unnamed protein product [Strongylus vulgaris]
MLSRSRATKVANDLSKREGLRISVASRRGGNRYVFVLTKNLADLVTQLDSTDGDYDRYLSIVTNEISRKKHGLFDFDDCDTM